MCRFLQKLQNRKTKAKKESDIHVSNPKMDREKFTMFSAAPGGAWSQEVMRDMERASSSASTERPSASKESLALRKKIERAHTTAF